ncbi:MAG: exodeoxyribonuclease VII large subunit [Bryobacteraceae bacterium]|nr:exodeoxyribonuclease VII large subunit [Bryobacteraceae bacterium]
MEQISLNWEPERRTYTVGELTQAVRNLLDRELGDVWVLGEISGTKSAPSGHCYFTLKDQDAQLQCVCFRSSLRLLRFKPQDGVQALARGRLDVFPPRGSYQLLVEALEPQGYGALQHAFEQLKKRLALEGLFDAARKKALPPFPRRIGIVTSPAGAAIRDLVEILSRRAPGVHVRLYPAQVQGAGSVEGVVAGIDYFGRSGWADVVIVGRGGGSIEDLWTFNEEPVARAIAACSVPVVSAVGHETDFTIADFVADLRAPTPSAAAELVVPERRKVLEQVDGCRRKLEQAVRYCLVHARTRLHDQGVDRAIGLLRRNIMRSGQRVDELDFRLRELARGRLNDARRSLEGATARLLRQDLRLRFSQTRRRLERTEAAAAQRIRIRLGLARRALDQAAAQLRQLSPLRVLERGYAIVQDAEGRVVRRAEEAPVKANVRIRLFQGRLRARITESHQAATEPSS